MPSRTLKLRVRARARSRRAISSSGLSVGEEALIVRGLGHQQQDVGPVLRTVVCPDQQRERLGLLAFQDQGTREADHGIDISRPDLQRSLEHLGGAVHVTGPKRRQPEIVEHVEIGRIGLEDDGKRRLSLGKPLHGDERHGEGKTVPELAGRFLLQFGEQSFGSRLLVRTPQRSQLQQSNRELLLLGLRQSTEAPQRHLEVLLINGQLSQLQIGVRMGGFACQDFRKRTSRLFQVAPRQVMVPEIVQERR